MVKLLEGTKFAGMAVDGRMFAPVPFGVIILGVVLGVITGMLGVIILGVVVRMLVVIEETLELGNAELTIVPFDNDKKTAKTATTLWILFIIFPYFYTRIKFK